MSCEIFNYSHEHVAVEDVDGIDAGTNLADIAGAMDNIYMGVRNQLAWTVATPYTVDDIVTHNEFAFKALNSGTSGSTNVFTGVDEDTPGSTNIVDNDITWTLVLEDDVVVTDTDMNKKIVQSIIEPERSEESDEFDDFY